MKQPLILSLVITLLSGIYGYHINAQESINPLVLCAETVTLKASPTRDLRSGSTSPKELEGAEFSFSSEEQTHPIYALAVDLSVTFTNKEGYFSILFEDQAGKHLLDYLAGSTSSITTMEQLSSLHKRFTSYKPIEIILL